MPAEQQDYYTLSWCNDETRRRKRSNAPTLKPHKNYILIRIPLQGKPNCSWVFNRPMKHSPTLSVAHLYDATLPPQKTVSLPYRIQIHLQSSKSSSFE